MGLLQQGEGLGVVKRGAAAVEVLHGKVAPSLAVALLRGFAVPREGLGAVLGDAEVAVEIGFAEAGLGLDLRQRYRCGGGDGEQGR